jgi:hypothetical protein
VEDKQESGLRQVGKCK